MAQLWGGVFAGGLDPHFESFNRSLSFDRRMVLQDLQGSIAWARALHGASVLTAGETEQFIVATLDDDVVEATETFTVNLNATNPLVADTDTATGAITDNNTAMVSVVATTQASEEGPVNGQFTVTQTVPSSTDTVISYTVGGTGLMPVAVIFAASVLALVLVSLVTSPPREEVLAKFFPGDLTQSRKGAKGDAKL